jgi:signal transduction histidine kinase
MEKSRQSTRMPVETAPPRKVRARTEGSGAKSTAYGLITRNAAHAVQVARVGVWLFEGSARLTCRNLFESEGASAEGQALEEREFPAYFKALSERRTVVAHDARHHAVTRELFASYLAPRGITSMLAVPVVGQDCVTGVISLEHIGPKRTWTPREVEFAGSAADLAEHLLEQINRADHPAEHKLEERQTFETDKLETLARMARLVAHDFNNVLAICALTAEDATSRQCAECNDSWRGIKEAIQAGHRLSRKLLHIGLRQRDEGDPNDLGLLLNRLSGSLSSLAGARATLTIDVRESKPWVTLPEAEMEQIVFGLVANARDAVAEPGKIDIIVRRAEEAHHSPSEFLVLEVKDNGAGMDERVRSHLFEPYFTTKKSGLGLSLATIYGVLKRNGSTIEAATSPGKGTTFRLTLPRAIPR